jgi:RHS repeat-associated protein
MNKNLEYDLMAQPSAQNIQWLSHWIAAANVPINHYVYTDHLGSINVITNATGIIEFTQSFDAWGKPRNATDWSTFNITPPPVWLYRGFTGHEMMPEFALINMNARLYDYVVGRMISPDNLMHAGTQGLNRYTCAMNNPLKYVDPDGNSSVYSFFGLHNFGETAQYIVPVVVGIATGGIAAAIVGTALITAGGFVTGAKVGAISGGLSGFLSSVAVDAINGNPINFEKAFSSMVYGAISGALMGGITSGIKAEMDGRDFWTGATKKVVLYSKTTIIPGEEVTPECEEETRLEYLEKIKKIDPKIKRPRSFNPNKPGKFWEFSAAVLDKQNVSSGVDGVGFTTNLEGNIYDGPQQASTFLHPRIKQNYFQFREVLEHEYLHAIQFGDGSITHWMHSYSAAVVNAVSEIRPYKFSMNYYKNYAGYEKPYLENKTSYFLSNQFYLENK